MLGTDMHGEAHDKTRRLAARYVETLRAVEWAGANGVPQYVNNVLCRQLRELAGELSRLALRARLVRRVSVGEETRWLFSGSEPVDQATALARVCGLLSLTRRPEAVA